MTQREYTWHYELPDVGLVTMTDQQFEYRDYYPMYFWDDAGRDRTVNILMFNYGWWAHPHFLFMMDKCGIKMETSEDLASFVNRLYEHPDNSTAKINELVEYGYHVLQQVQRTCDGCRSYSAEAREDYGLDLAIGRINRGSSGRSYSFDYHTDGCTHMLIDPSQEVGADPAEIPEYYVWECWEPGGLIVGVPNGAAGGDEYYYKRNNYTFKPEPKFMSLEKERTQRYFGMEIEVCTEISEKELQSIVTNIDPKQEPFFYMKDDSSLDGEMSWRYEIVTHPMSPRRMRREWRTLFRKMEKLAAERGMELSDVFDMNTECNGIHIHVSNDAFIVPNRSPFAYTKPALHQNKFMTAFNQWDKNFESWMQKVTKRVDVGSESDYFFPHMKMRDRTLAYRLKNTFNTHGDNRHAACHTENGVTTEVRVFAGIWSIDHILSCIDIVDAMVDFTSLGHTTKVAGRRFIPAFTEFVTSSNRYPNAKETLTCA